MAPRVVNLITGNTNKLADIKAILEPRGIQVESQELDLPEIQGTIEDITIAKCRRAAELVRAVSLFLPFFTPYFRVTIDSGG